MSLASFLGLDEGYKDAANAKIQGLQQGYGQASDLYGQGRGALTTNYGAALAPYTSLWNSASGGANAYGDATGANGAAGFARAVNNFRTDPGYQFQFNQGLQAIDRGAASRGMLTSGNTLNAEQQFGTGLADQSYGNYVNRLQPYLGQQTAAAGGIAGVNRGLGNALNTSFGNQGNLAYNTAVGQGDAQAAADIASQNASNSFLQGALGLGSKLLGFSGLPSFGSGGGVGENPV